MGIKQEIEAIFELEEENNFNEVFELYNSLYSKNKLEYEVWRNFYFFLRNSIEDATSEFHKKIRLEELMQKMLNEGKNNFSELADFNFIAGYTVSIFPCQYGYSNLEIDTIEINASEMLKKATELEPENMIYKIAYWGNIRNVDANTYRNLRINASPIISKIFSGKGTLNKYFRQVLGGNS